MLQLTPVVERLLQLNIGLFLAIKFLGLDLVDLLGLRYVLSEHFRPYQFLTHLFVHAGFMHLFSNMFALVTFGPILEHTLSSKRFVLFYLLTGLGAAALYAGVCYLEVSKVQALYHTYLAYPSPASFDTFLSKFPQATHSSFSHFIHTFFKYPDDPAYIARSKAIVSQLYRFKADMPTVGASGAIFGILTAFAMLFPNAQLSLLFLPIPIRAKYFIVLYGLYELYAGIQDNPTDNVAHFAHLGGILLGYLFIRWWKRSCQ